MKILFTGASSFTGYWFVQALIKAGHEVTAIFQQAATGYSGVRRKRVNGLQGRCQTRFACPFGSAEFLDLIAGEGSWDLLCHHAADVTNYKSPDFDVLGAVANNTHQLAEVLEALEERGCHRLLLTGSVFEGGEGAGSDGLPAFSPYGLSKELTARLIRFHTRRRGWHLGKLVIPNPFGPLEEPRFTDYLIRTWAQGNPAAVNTPDYVRDNIHVDLLAKVYTNFASQLPAQSGESRLNPSGYIESQGRFAQRFAAEMEARLGIACRLDLAVQTAFDEPLLRINTDPASGLVAWEEGGAWDALADYYGELHGIRRQEAARG